MNWLAGMPQGHAVAPFKAPLDESKVMIKWHEYVDPSGNKFPDGETYSLRYPEVSFPRDAVYAYNQGVLTDAQMGDYDVRIEVTIGIYGTGLLDAIADAAPRTVPQSVADAICDLYVYHNDRVAPFSTLARDFTLKRYGTDSYNDLTPEQVIAGWHR